MGIGKGATFSRDVLKLELSGPDREHLSVVDISGTFHNPTKNATTVADMEMVRDLVHSYMANPRSILLAVIPADVDLATHEILSLAQRLDEEGQRTLGFRKPRMRRSLKGALLDGLTERYNKALEHTEFLLGVERHEPPVTFDARFNEESARGLVITSLCHCDFPTLLLDATSDE